MKIRTRCIRILRRSDVLRALQHVQSSVQVFNLELGIHPHHIIFSQVLPYIFARVTIRSLVVLLWTSQLH